MPRYFFHLRGPDTYVPDPDGEEFANADDAWEAAQRTAQTLMRTEVDTDAEWLTRRFEVVDAAGEIVFELPFSEVLTGSGTQH